MLVEPNQTHTQSYTDRVVADAQYDSTEWKSKIWIKMDFIQQFIPIGKIKNAHQFGITMNNITEKSKWIVADRCISLTTIKRHARTMGHIGQQRPQRSGKINRLWIAWPFCHRIA